jgi:hypothetical protein
MYPVADSLPVPVLDLQALQYKLLGLRAEIDAILMQLSPVAIPAEQEESGTAPPQPKTIEALEPIETDSPKDQVNAEIAAPAAIALHPGACNDLVSDTQCVEPSFEVVVTTGVLASTSQPADVSGEAPAAFGLAETEPNISLIRPTDRPDESDPQAEATSETPVPTSPDTTNVALASVADVIQLEPRQHKEKAASVSRRPSRKRLAGKIAAGIATIIAAGTALVAADRGALRSPQDVLVLVSQLPSYQRPWVFLGEFKRAATHTLPGITAVQSKDARETSLLRYREVWPLSP